MGMFSELKKIEEQKTEEKKKIVSDVPPVQSPPPPTQKKSQKTLGKQQNKLTFPICSLSEHRCGFLDGTP
jgi:hypothetical protein